MYTVAASGAIAAGMAVYGYRRRSLTADGAVVAMITGWITFWVSSVCGITLIAFFLLASRATKYKQSIKKTLETDYKEGGQRDAVQVLCNSFPATVSLVIAQLYPTQRESCLVSFFAFYACCTGDTFSSELGILSTGKPIHVLTLARVPKGFNGGVSFLGLVAAGLGGLAVASTVSLYALLVHHPLPAHFLPLFVLYSTVGSLLDSAIGATLQATYWCPATSKVHSSPKHPHNYTNIGGWPVLSNSMVNITAGLVTMYVAVQ